jgi:hypothetical protein
VRWSAVFASLLLHPFRGFRGNPFLGSGFRGKAFNSSSAAVWFVDDNIPSRSRFQLLRAKFGDLAFASGNDGLGHKTNRAGTPPQLAALFASPKLVKTELAPA